LQANRIRPPSGATARFQTPLGTLACALLGNRHRSGAFSLSQGNPRISSRVSGRSIHLRVLALSDGSGGAGFTAADVERMAARLTNRTTTLCLINNQWPSIDKPCRHPLIARIDTNDPRTSRTKKSPAWRKEAVIGVNSRNHRIANHPSRNDYSSSRIALLR
jgi:hypothetical protein